MAKTYSPKRVSVSFRGVLLTGFAPDTFVTAERNEDAFTLEVGSDGESSRTASANQSGTVTLTLMQTSASNDALSAAALQDETNQSGTGALLVKDASGRTVVLAAEAWIRRRAAAEFGSEQSTREWVFETGNLEIFNGGN